MSNTPWFKNNFDRFTIEEFIKGYVYVIDIVSMSNQFIYR